MRNGDAYSKGNRRQSGGDSRESSADDSRALQTDGRLPHDDYELPRLCLDSLWFTLHDYFPVDGTQPGIHGHSAEGSTWSLHTGCSSRTTGPGHAHDKENTGYQSLTLTTQVWELNRCY